MTLSSIFHVLSGTSNGGTRVRVISSGSEVINDYYFRLKDYEKKLNIHSARYDEKHNVLTVTILSKECARYIDILKGEQK